MNKCAIENSKNHIIARIAELRKAESLAIKENRIASQIEMYHDEAIIWEQFLKQL